jgi:hypothetical protein
MTYLKHTHTPPDTHSIHTVSRCVNSLFYNTQEDALPTYDRDVQVAFARAERMLPSFWSTIAKHDLTHLFQPKQQNGTVVRGGSAGVTGMLDSERSNKKLNRMVNSSKGLAAGLANEASVLFELILDKIHRHPEMMDIPAWASRETRVRLRHQVHGKHMELDAESVKCDRLVELWRQECPEYDALVTRVLAAQASG